MYESGDLRKGLKIEIDGDPYVIVKLTGLTDQVKNLMKQTLKRLRWNICILTIKGIAL